MEVWVAQVAKGNRVQWQLLAEVGAMQISDAKSGQI